MTLLLKYAKDQLTRSHPALTNCGWRIMLRLWLSVVIIFYPGHRELTKQTDSIALGCDYERPLAQTELNQFHPRTHGYPERSQ